MGAKSYVFRSYRGKTGRGNLSPILNRVKNQVLAVLEKQKKKLQCYNFWNSNIYGSDIYYFSTRYMCLFTKFAFLGLLARENGEPCSALWPCFLWKIPRLREFMGTFLVTDAVLEVPGWKKLQFFPMSPFAYFCSWNFSQNGLVSRNLLCPENSWFRAWLTTISGWQRKLLDFGPARTFTF